MKKFKFQVPKGTRPLTREELKHIYGGIITDVNQYNCSDTVPRQIGACKGKQEGSICIFTYSYYKFPNSRTTKHFTGSCQKRGTCPDLFCE